MVTVRDRLLETDIDTIDIRQWSEDLALRWDLALDELPPSLTAAGEVARQAQLATPALNRVWTREVSCLHSGLEMVEILAEFQLDTTALQAGLLYRAVREGRLALSQIEQQFGAEVSGLIEQVQRMAVVSTLRNDSSAEVFGDQGSRQAGKIRQMLVSLIDDVRVPLIKLAERTCAIRAVKSADTNKQLRVAREIFDIYAPLADRLGIGHLKWELEDLAFRYLEPDDYKAIAKLLAEKRSQRQDYIDEVVATLKEQLAAADIAGEISGRAKHIYSIWRKMQRKEVGFSQVYDIRAVRVLVPSVADCYTLLSWVHANWRAIPKEFDDYIAHPKENGYRSLHTAVVGPDNKVVEIQIRTFDMHRESELGVCAHWRYKSGDGDPAARDYESKIEWLRQVLSWQQQLESQAGGPTVAGVNDQRVYVFTPEGHVVDLPRGSTPLDFAYHIHTDIGHRCRGAKVNGRLVALTTELATADRVEIITAEQGAPSRDWLRSTMGYLASSRAREKISQWFRRQRHTQALEEGEKLWQRAWKEAGRPRIDLDELAPSFNKVSERGLLIALGSGELHAAQLLRHAQGPKQLPASKARAKLAYAPAALPLVGLEGMLHRLAGCCAPQPGCAVGGFITQGRGVSVHRAECKNFKQLCSVEPERVLAISWAQTEQVGETSRQLSDSVRLDLAYVDRTGLLLAVTALLNENGSNIIDVETVAEAAGRRTLRMWVELPSDTLATEALYAALRQIEGVTSLCVTTNGD